MIYLLHSYVGAITTLLLCFMTTESFFVIEKKNVLRACGLAWINIGLICRSEISA